jgi:hypothetical protein
MEYRAMAITQGNQRALVVVVLHALAACAGEASGGSGSGSNRVVGGEQPGECVDDSCATGNADGGTADAGREPEGGCPVIATECPAECLAVRTYPIRPGTACASTNQVVLGCYHGSLDLTLAGGCAKGEDGTLYSVYSSTLAGRLFASGSYERCSIEEWSLVAGAEFCPDAGAR